MRREKGSSHTGALILFDAETGEPAAIMDSGLPTAMRTAAASAVATDALARKDAAVLAILGTGEQAEWHIAAMRAVRPIRAAAHLGPQPRQGGGAGGAACRPRRRRAIDAACAGADIICTVTGAATPILHAAQLPEGVHVNAVGASLPSLQEIAPDCHGACRTFVDYRPSADAQAGELIAARAAGHRAEGRELPEIGEVLSGKAPGRTDRRRAHALPLARHHRAGFGDGVFFAAPRGGEGMSAPCSTFMREATR